MPNAILQIGVSGGERDLPLTLMGIAGLGPWELVIILAIILVVFGAGKLPQIGGSLGQAIKNFKKGVKDVKDEDRDEDMSKDVKDTKH